MLDIFIFTITDDFENFHRRPILTRLSEKLKETRITYFTRPKLFFHWFFKKHKKDKQMGAITVCDLYSLAPISWCYSNTLLMYLLVSLPIRFQLALRSRKLGAKNKLLWFYKPDQWLYLKPLKLPHFFIYYDNYSLDRNYPFARHSSYNAVLNDCILLSKTSLICSHKLYQPYSALPQVCHFPNAVDESFIEEIPPPKEHQRKIIGFVGVINHSINLTLIGKICKQLPECDVVMIGPIETPVACDVQKKHSNLKLLGSFPYQELSKEIACFDVGICPYKDSRFNQYRNPLKIYEYSSKGVATVSSECDFHGPEGIVSIAHNDQDFIKYVKMLLEEQTDKSASLRIEFARNNTWSKRVEFIQNRLEVDILTSREQRG